MIVERDGTPRLLFRFPVGPGHVRWAFLFDTAVGHPSAMVRKRVYQDLGGYTTWALHCEDYELWT